MGARLTIYYICHFSRIIAQRLWGPRSRDRPDLGRGGGREEDEGEREGEGDREREEKWLR